MNTVIDPAKLDEAARRLDERFGLAALWLFGSEAQGQSRRDSDIDLAALFCRRVCPNDLQDARTDLAALFGRDVDLVDLSRASPALGMQVLRHGKLIADACPSIRIDFQMLLPSRYEDLRIVRAPVERALKERLRG